MNKFFIQDNVCPIIGVSSVCIFLLVALVITQQFRLEDCQKANEEKAAILDECLFGGKTVQQPEAECINENADIQEERLSSEEFKSELGMEMELPSGWTAYKHREYGDAKFYVIKQGQSYLMNITAWPKDTDYSILTEGHLGRTSASCGVNYEEWKNPKANTIDDFCKFGCRKINDYLAYVYGVRFYGDYTYSGIALSTKSENFETVCFEYHLDDILMEESARLDINYYDLAKKKDSEYFWKLIENQEITAVTQNKIEDFESFLNSFKPLE